MTPESIATLLETLMIICFGLSWPLSVYKSWKSRTAKGKSLQFELFIWVGYIFGITKNILLFANGKTGWVFFLGWIFYVINFCFISMDIALYFRNTKLDKAAEAAQK